MFRLIPKIFLIVFLLSPLFYSKASYAVEASLKIGSGGFEANGWFACVMDISGDNDRIIANERVVPHPNLDDFYYAAFDLPEASETYRFVIHGYGENSNIGNKGFNRPDIDIPLTFRPNFDGPYCDDNFAAGSDPEDEDIGEMSFQDQVNEIRADMIRCGMNPMCIMAQIRRLINLLMFQFAQITDLHNPGRVIDPEPEGEHPFMQIYEFSKDDKCITCHSFTAMDIVNNNSGDVRESEALRQRIIAIRNLRQHRRPHAELEDPQNCMGCHGNWAPKSDGPGIQSNGVMDNWMAPPPEMNFFGLTPEQMCRRFLTLFNADNDLEHHLKEDGRVLWPLRQHPVAGQNPDSADNPWIQAVDAWLDILGRGDMSWCPE